MSDARNVIVLNDLGEPIGAKPRTELTKDSGVHSIAVLIKHDDGRMDFVKAASHRGMGEYTDRWGMSACAMLREGETEEEAALRALSSDWLVDTAPGMVKVHEAFYVFNDGAQKRVTLFVFPSWTDCKPNPAEVTDTVRLNVEEVDMLTEEQLVPYAWFTWKDARQKIAAVTRAVDAAAV